MPGSSDGSVSLAEIITHPRFSKLKESFPAYIMINGRRNSSKPNIAHLVLLKLVDLSVNLETKGIESLTPEQFIMVKDVLDSVTDKDIAVLAEKLKLSAYNGPVKYIKHIVPVDPAK